MRLLNYALTLLLIAPTMGISDPISLRIASGDYAPYTGRTLPNGGIVNTYIQSMADRLGIQVEFDYLPWKRALETTREGKYHATSYWYFSEARDADFIHVGPVVHERLTFFVRMDSPVQDWTDLRDLSGLRIGVVPGYTYTQEMWDLGAEGVLTLSEAQTDIANLRKLLAGRIDVFVMTDQAGRLLIQKMFTADEQKKFRQLAKPLSHTGGYLLVSRNLPNAVDLATLLQTAADALALRKDAGQSGIQ